MIWQGIVAICTAIGKAFDFINPWSKRWINKLDGRDKKKDIAQNKIDKAVKNEASDDDFLDAVNDKLGA